MFLFNPPIVQVFIDHFELRNVKLKDAQALADFYKRNADHLKPWEPKRHLAIIEKGYWKPRLREIIYQQERGNAYSFVLKNKDQIIGIIHLFGISRGSFDAARISYALDKDYLKQGLIFRSLQQVLSFAFQELKIHQIIAAYMPRNTSSANVLKKLNFKEIGLAESYLEINDKWEDHILTQLVNPYN